MEATKIKIAIITTSLAGGGAERSSALLSVLLSNFGYQVTVISVLDDIEYAYKGELLNLGLLKKKNDTLLGRLNRLFVFKKYLGKNNFDWVIDNRIRTSSWSEFIISRFILNPKKAIYVVRSFNIELYFPKNKFIAKSIYKKAPYIIAVSNEIKEAIQDRFSYKNVISIYNPIDQEELIQLSNTKVVPEKFIMAYGRIEDEIKNFSLLIDAYSKSILPHENIPLYIIGDGKDVDALKAKANDLHLAEKIIFKPKLENPFPYVKAAIFTVLTSRYEGFPRVIIESLALGTPVISVNCKSGPKEIILNEQNGLLVENYNVQELSNAMNRLIEEHSLYNTCKNNASKSVEHLSLASILKHWQQILSK